MILTSKDDFKIEVQKMINISYDANVANTQAVQ